MNNIQPTNQNIRQLLMSAAIAVINGKITPHEANALSNLVGEMHKNKRLELIERVISKHELSIHQELEAIGYVK